MCQIDLTDRPYPASKSACVGAPYTGCGRFGLNISDSQVVRRAPEHAPATKSLDGQCANWRSQGMSSTCKKESKILPIFNSRATPPACLPITLMLALRWRLHGMSSLCLWRAAKPSCCAYVSLARFIGGPPPCAHIICSISRGRPQLIRNFMQYIHSLAGCSMMKAESRRTPPPPFANCVA